MTRTAQATASGRVTSRVVADLIAIIGPENVLHRRDEMLVYECDGYMVEKRVPDVVVFPTSTEHVVEVVKLCSRYEKTSRLTSAATAREPKRLFRPVTVRMGLPGSSLAPPAR